MKLHLLQALKCLQQRRNRRLARVKKPSFTMLSSRAAWRVMNKHKRSGYRAGRHEMRVLSVPGVCRKGAESMKSIPRISEVRGGLQPLLIRPETLRSGAGYADKLPGRFPTIMRTSHCSSILFKGWSHTKTQLCWPLWSYDTGAKPRSRERVSNRDRQPPSSLSEVTVQATIIQSRANLTTGG